MDEPAELQEATALCFQGHFCATEAKALMDSKAHCLTEDMCFITWIPTVQLSNGRASTVWTAPRYQPNLSLTLPSPSRRGWHIGFELSVRQQVPIDLFTCSSFKYNSTLSTPITTCFQAPPACCSLQGAIQSLAARRVLQVSPLANASSSAQWSA